MGYKYVYYYYFNELVQHKIRTIWGGPQKSVISMFYCILKPVSINY